MAKVRSPDREKAEKLYLEANGNIKLIEIANTLGVSDGTVRGWKNKDKWDEKLNGTFQKKNKKDTERSKRKKGGQPNNKNAVGHGAPIGNKNAETYGFFSKYLPEETIEIMKEIETRSPIDLLWDNIMIQYTAIIRAQRIMYVRDKTDITRVLRKSKGIEIDGQIINTEEEWEYQHAWDKQANFLQAQSRAMAELRNMIKRYEEMLLSDLATEEQKLRIEKLKLDIGINKEKLEKGNETDKPIEIKIIGFDENE